jgi:hypothetical protein
MKFKGKIIYKKYKLKKENNKKNNDKMDYNIYYYVSNMYEENKIGEKFLVQNNCVFPITNPEKLFDLFENLDPDNFLFKLWLVLVIKKEMSRTNDTDGFSTIEIIREFTDEEYKSIFGIIKNVNGDSMKLHIKNEKKSYIINYQNSDNLWRVHDPIDEVGRSNGPAIRMWNISTNFVFDSPDFIGHVKNNEFFREFNGWYKYFNNNEERKKTYESTEKLVMYSDITRKWYEFDKVKFNKEYSVKEHLFYNVDFMGNFPEGF